MGGELGMQLMAGGLPRRGWAAVVAGALMLSAIPARADDADDEVSSTATSSPLEDHPLLAQYYPPPGYYPPPAPPPGYYPPPPPPRRRYYAPAPPPPPYSPVYFDFGLTLGVPLLAADDIDGNGDPGYAVGIGLGLHLDAGFKANRYWGLGVDVAWGGYAITSGPLWDLGHLDLGLIVRGFRGGIGLAWVGDDLGGDLYFGHFWQIGGPWVVGLSGDLMWDPEGGNRLATLNFEVGWEFGNR